MLHDASTDRGNLAVFVQLGLIHSAHIDLDARLDIVQGGLPAMRARNGKKRQSMSICVFDLGSRCTVSPGDQDNSSQLTSYT